MATILYHYIIILNYQVYEGLEGRNREHLATDFQSEASGPELLMSLLLQQQPAEDEPTVLASPPTTTVGKKKKESFNFLKEREAIGMATGGLRSTSASSNSFYGSSVYNSTLSV